MPHPHTHPTPLLVALLLAPSAVAGCDHGRAPDAQPQAAPQARTEGPTSAAPADRAVAPSVVFQRAPGVQLGRPQQLALRRAARRFATSLTRWLYGTRRSLDVDPVAPAVRRELAHAPPYIPADQRGRQDGQAHRVDIAPQTAASGVLTVTVADSRTSYRIPASFEHRTGRWLIVHLHTH